MSGFGQAWGAVTIINATATGQGCSLAIDAPVEATWIWGGDGLRWDGSGDDRLAQAALAWMQDWLDRRDGATVSTSATMPPGRGLKTSSSAATAMVRAALHAAGEGDKIDADRLDGLCVDAATQAGVTLTGAYDDQVAVAHGGCALTDNAARRIVRRIPSPGRDVAVWVPDARIDKSALRSIDVAAARPGVQEAIRLLTRGDVAGAMSANSAAYMPIYQAAGLPVDDAPVQAAMRYGALGAGLSGTGPAVAAIFEGRTGLPDVPGGTWRWHRSVEAA